MNENRKFKIGDAVFVSIKNRWGLDCAATIEAVHENTVDATVWNMDGLGANRLITGIPYSVLIISDVVENI
jgi:hypothetical protein